MKKQDDTPAQEEVDPATVPPEQSEMADAGTGPEETASAVEDAAQENASAPVHAAPEYTPHPTAPAASSGTSAPSLGTSAPNVGGGGGTGTAAPSVGGGSSYPPLPAAKKKKGVLARVFSFPALVALLLIIIVILFIWGITAREQTAPVKAPPEKVLQVTPAAPGITEAQPAPKLSGEEQKQLMNARSAYWHHDLSAAIDGYHALIQQAPNAAFVYGELGNVYYMTGNREKAAENFEHAAMLLIQQGQSARATSLIPVLGALDPALAQKVQIALSHSPEDDGYGVNNMQ